MPSEHDLSGDPADRLIPLKNCPIEFIDLIPERGPGQPITARTLLNWSTRGVSGVTLKIRYVGHKCCTTRRWLQEFVDAVTAAKTSHARDRNDCSPPVARP